MNDQGELVIEWMTQPSAPDSVMALAHCTAGCKKSGCGDATKCTCLQNGIPCTDLCKCARVNCSNVGGHHTADETDEDEDDSEPEESDVEN